MSKRIALLPVVLALAAGPAFAAGPASTDGSQPVKGPFAGTVHAALAITYVDGSSQSWAWDRGRISAVSSSSITLTRRDKEQVTFAITSSTAVRNDGATYGQADLKVGLAATVISQGGNAVTIRNIRGDGAPSGADPSALTGPLAKSVTGTVDAQSVDGSHQTFEYDRGLITAAGSGELTVQQPGGKELTFTYGDSTVVRDCKGQLESTSDLAKGETAMFFSQGSTLDLAACVRQMPARNGNGSGSGPAVRGGGAPTSR